MRTFASLLLLAALAAAPAAALDRPRDWEPPPPELVPNHRELWREVVTEFGTFMKGRNKDLVVLVRTGAELVVKGDREAQWEQVRDPAGLNFEKRLPLGTVFRPYMKVVDGIVVDGLYCGPYAFDTPLDQAIRDRKQLDAELAEERRRGINRPPVPVPLGPFSLDSKEELRKHEEWRQNLARAEVQRARIYAIDAMRQQGRRILSIENCADQKQADAAARNSDRDRVLTFAGVGIGALDVLPKGHARAESAQPVTAITAARNWLPMLRGDRFGTKAEWLMALEKTNHDIVVVDVAHRGIDPLTKDDVKRLKFKQLGAPRLVLAAFSVGKASDLRWYWKKEWRAGNPAFLVAPIAEQPGTFYADLGDKAWRAIIGKYLGGILDLGFDGVLIDDLDTYLWFEDLMPLKD